MVFAVALALYGLAFHRGMVPSWLNPLPPIDLEQPDAFLQDWRLQVLAFDKSACVLMTAQPQMGGQLVNDRPFHEGCGWRNAVRLSKSGGAELAPVVLSCPVSASFTLWMQHAVQPAAQRLLGSRVARVHHAGGFACRNVKSDRAIVSRFRSAHASANALDVMGFTLADGRRIDIRSGWSANDDTERVLRTIHKAACSYFRLVLGPAYNKSHADHFHLDRGSFIRCR